MWTLRIASLVLAAACALAGPALAACPGPPASPNDPHRAGLQQALDTYRAEHGKADGFSGVSLHVSLSDNGPVIDLASGSTSFQDGRPICPGTLFQIGSITKSFTAVLILQLEAEGKLDINDPIGKFLPQYPAWSSITIKQLLNMTAPTDDYVLNRAYQKDVVADIGRNLSPAEMVGYVYPGKPGAKPPPWQYVNTNYVLAAMIASKITGTPYAELLRKRLFEPLHLDETFFQPGVPPAPVLAAMASGYAEQSLCRSVAKTTPPCPQWPIDDLLGHDMKTAAGGHGDGGIIASLPDVARWVRALFGETLLPPRQRAELFALVSQKSGRPIAVTSPADPAGFSLGLHQNWLPLTGNPLWAYMGETFGYEVLWGRRAGDEAIIVLAQNSATADNNIAALYETVLRIIEPKSIIPAPAQ